VAELPGIGGPLQVGVALGAGSAAALAEIGALEVLAEAAIPIHQVAGTSAGAVVGAALAADRLRGLRECLEGLSRRQVLRLFDVGWPREGFLRGRRALELVSPHLGDRIEALPRPFAAVATDLRTGDEIVVREGPVFDAVRASIAIPGIFTPWRVDGRLLVDGGLVDPVPVSAARALGAAFVIAIQVLPVPTEPAAADDPGPVAPEPGLIDVGWQATRILTAQVASLRLRADRPDYLLQIPVPAVGTFDLHRTAELVEAGRRSAEQALPELQRALSRAIPRPHGWRRWPARSRRLANDLRTALGPALRARLPHVRAVRP